MGKRKQAHTRYKGVSSSILFARRRKTSISFALVQNFCPSAVYKRVVFGLNEMSCSSIKVRLFQQCENHIRRENSPIPINSYFGIHIILSEEWNKFANPLNINSSTALYSFTFYVKQSWNRL